jgi:enamine deaminase RidA (YjgF/YER057c/UK114 family)
MVTHAKQVGAEQPLCELSIHLPATPTPFGPYLPGAETGNLWSLSGMLPTEGHAPKVVGRLGNELDLEAERDAAYVPTLNAIAVVKQQLGSLDRVSRVVRLGVSLATSNEFSEHIRIADAASELLGDIFGAEGILSRMIFGVSSLPLRVPVELELITTEERQ